MTAWRMRARHATSAFNAHSESQCKWIGSAELRQVAHTNYCMRKSKKNWRWMDIMMTMWWWIELGVQEAVNNGTGYVAGERSDTGLGWSAAINDSWHLSQRLLPFLVVADSRWRSFDCFDLHFTRRNESIYVTNTIVWLSAPYRADGVVPYYAICKSVPKCHLNSFHWHRLPQSASNRNLWSIFCV